jgi:chemotaxis methyl-accepting protein methylase/HEAT repeat protein
VPAALFSAADERLVQQASELAARGATGVPELLALFQERSWAVRRAAVAALSSLDAPGLERLVGSLVAERAHEPTVAGMVDALSAASPSAEPWLLQLLGSTETAVLCDAIQIAGRRRQRAAVPELIRLTAHEDDNVALSAVEALGRIGGSPAVDRLLELAEGDNFFRVFPAIDALGAAREERALPTLQRLMQKPLYATEAARTLGKLGSVTAVEPLVRALESGNDALVRVIATSLVAIEEASEQRLAPAAAVSRAVREHARDRVRVKVTRALASADGSEAVALGRVLIWLAAEESVSDLIPLLGTNAELTKLAIVGLQGLGALAEPQVLAALASGSSELRGQLLPALSGVAAADPAIAACLDDPQPSIRALACHTLARSGATNAVPRLFQLLDDPDLGVVHAAVGAIQSLGSAETEPLALAAVASENAAERRAALRIVTYFGYSATLELARQALASNDERLREIALAGLPALEDATAHELLLETSRHPAPRTRAAAIRALGHVAGGSGVEAALVGALQDDDAWVRYYACQSLGRRRDPAAVPLLVERLSDRAEQVKLAAVEALATIPGAAAGEALRGAARSDGREVERAAIVGIGARKDLALRDELLRSVQSADAGVRLVSLASLAAFPGAEAELERAARSDADGAVRGSAVEHLASLSNAAATAALARLLGENPTSKELLSALAQNVEARIPTLLSLLGASEESLARSLVAVLARADSRAARAAVDIAFESGNVAARRAAAHLGIGVQRGDRMSGAIRISPQVFAILSALIEEHLGLFFSPDYCDLLTEKLVPRAVERGFESMLDYYYFLRYDAEGGAELAALADVLTVNETYFFREAQQLKVLVADFLAPRAESGRRLRVWCAACSTGEEAISLAALLDQRQLLSRVELIASDVSARALKIARRGVYGRRSLRSLEVVPEWLRGEGEQHAADERLRSCIDWRQINLLDDGAVSALGEFDAIMCRNVLIYFRDETIQAVVGRLHDRLRSDGLLLVGASESLMRLGTAFICEERGGSFFYRKRPS